MHTHCSLLTWFHLISINQDLWNKKAENAIKIKIFESLEWIRLGRFTSLLSRILNHLWISSKTGIHRFGAELVVVILHSIYLESNKNRNSHTYRSNSLDFVRNKPKWIQAQNLQTHWEKLSKKVDTAKYREKKTSLLSFFFSLVRVLNANCKARVRKLTRKLCGAFEEKFSIFVHTNKPNIRNFIHKVLRKRRSFYCCALLLLLYCGLFRPPDLLHIYMYATLFVHIMDSYDKRNQYIIIAKNYFEPIEGDTRTTATDAKKHRFAWKIDARNKCKLIFLIEVFVRLTETLQKRWTPMVLPNKAYARWKMVRLFFLSLPLSIKWKTSKPNLYIYLFNECLLLSFSD